MEQNSEHHKTTNINKYCIKCGEKVTDNKLFCDSECRREYALEIFQDNDDVLGHFWRRD